VPGSTPTKPHRRRLETFGALAIGVSLAILGGCAGGAPEADHNVHTIHTNPLVRPRLSYPDAVDEVSRARAAYNAPKKMTVGKQYAIALRVSKKASLSAVEAGLPPVGRPVGFELQYYGPHMQATLSGFGFKILSHQHSPQSMELLPVTTWNWDVKPTRPGHRVLSLDLNVVDYAETGRSVGSTTVKHIRRTIKVVAVAAAPTPKSVALKHSAAHYGHSLWSWAVSLIGAGAIVTAATWLLTKRRRNPASADPGSET
jgi:hypothetical protein